MGEAKRREELGLPPREKKKEKEISKNQLNKILNKYPYLPFILGFSLLAILIICLLYTSPSPRDLSTSRMPSSA